MRARFTWALVASAMAWPAIAGAQLTAGQVARYRLDGSFEDTSPTGNHGRASGAVSFSSELPAAGRACNSASLAVSGGAHADADDHPALNPSTATWALWVNFARLPSAAGHSMNLISKAEQYWLHAANEPGATDVLQAKVVVDGARRAVSSPEGAIRPGSWQHVAGTYDGTTLRLYVDGAEVGTALAISGVIARTTSHLAIGSWSGHVDPFEGLVDEAGVWNRALTAAEIATLASQGPCAGAVPRARVGIMPGRAGDLITPLVAAAGAEVGIEVVRIDTAAADPFAGLDAFAYLNSAGPEEFSLGATLRGQLLAFARRGGLIYLGLDPANGGNDAPSIVGLFGARFRGDRQCVSDTGVVTDLSNPIASGPFRPAASYTVSCYDSFGQAGSGRFIGTTRRQSTGAVLDTLLYVAPGALAAGSGAVYVFSDEVPLFGGAGSEHLRLFENALTLAGARPTGAQCEDQVASLTSQIGDLNRRIDTLEAQRAQDLARIATLEGELAAANGRAAMCGAALAVAQQALGVCQGDLAGANASLEACAGDLAASNARALELERALADAQAANQRLTADLAEASEAIAGLTRQLAEANAANAALAEQLAEANAANRMLRAQLEEANAAMAQLRARVADLEGELAGASATIESLRGRITELTTALAAANAERERMEAVITRLESDLQSLFRDPGFRIAGTTPADRAETLGEALSRLSRGQKHVLYKLLGGKHPN